ncbi:type II toxin-antitoxin system HigB family toxin [Dyadobacter sp. CY107]|uniref:type II toxin-antitoxin system HigB family toxin n=1 Tax=Dyadobacter fanqingshengii TaxID=2906443 RepID=UPI001F3B106E|nr:type II toxin-antitoxin system HigB family toxin [Dyadobacter fanqingshengii]MCF2503844.1 type II toxin-antitoxin system HigB family toxin [Dyadobacter fanqingshengii]
MRVHLIKRATIEDFIISNPQCRSSFGDWLTKIKYADWDKPEDIKGTFGFADLLGNGTNRVVFNIAGNNYRMICTYVFGERQAHLFVCWIGTHATYTTLCKEQRQYHVNAY